MSLNQNITKDDKLHRTKSSGEADTFSADQQIPWLLWNQNASYSVLKNPPLALSLDIYCTQFDFTVFFGCLFQPNWLQLQIVL